MIQGQKLSQIYDDHISFNSRTLTIDKINRYFAGNYSCQVDTDKGTFESEGTPLPTIRTEVRILLRLRQIRIFCKVVIYNS